MLFQIHVSILTARWLIVFAFVSNDRGLIFLLVLCLSSEEMADGKLVTHYNVGDADPFLSLLKSILMPVQLRVDCTKLQVKSAFKFKFVDARRNTLVSERGILLVIHLIETGLKT